MKRKSRRGKSFYAVLEAELGQRARRSVAAEKIGLAEIIRSLRKQREISGADLCRKAGDLDARLLNAIEKGRVKNPSVKTLQSLARGLGITVSDLFLKAEMEIDRHFYLGTQKGAYQIDFPSWGVRAVSFTPVIKDFFCGKWIVSGKKRLEDTLLRHPKPIFAAAMVGRFEVLIEDKKFALKEGENLFFNGVLRHSFYNPLERDSVLFVVTAPSFF